MDPLSVAASVAGLLSLAIQVSQILHELVHTLKSAPKDAKKLLEELEALCQVLTSLERFLASQSSKGRSFKETSALVGAIQGCKTQISALKLRFEKLITKQGLAQRIERGKWYYEHDEHLEQIQALHRYLSMFHVSLNIDGIELLSKSADEVSQEIKSIKGAISALTPDPLEAEEKSKQLDEILTLLSPFTTMSESISEVTETVRYWDLKWQDEESRDILDWLSPLNFWKTQDDTLSRREPGTGQWIFQEPAFKEWLNGRQRTLWCPGMPGAGKTILASAVIDYIQHKFPQENIGLAFIYCNYKQTDEQTIVNLIASLSVQLLQRRSLSTKVRTMYQQHTSKRTRPTVSECLEVLHTELSSFSRAFVVIDALDECNDGNGTRSTLVDELLRLPTTTQLMFTSRYLPSIEIQLSEPCRLEIRASNADVRIYLEKQIHKWPRLRRHVQADHSLKEVILENVVNAAQGMFLLAQLHMDSLAQKHTRKDIRTALDSLPRKLDETYDEAMKRIRSQNTDDVELAKRVLTWILFALRPLTVTEMRHAIAVQPDQTFIDEDDLIPEDTLVSVCAGLVIIDQESEVIRLIHYTTQEYFERNRQKEFPDGQKNITETCLTYFTFKNFHSGYCENDSQMIERLQTNPLFQYAAQNWANHARGVVEGILQIQILEFLARKLELSSTVQAMFLPGYRHRGFSQVPPEVDFGLWVAAASGLAVTVTTLLEADINLINMRIDEGDTALSVAARRGHEGVVRRLLEKGADVTAPNMNGQTALHEAVWRGDEGIVQLLLEKGADVAAVNKSGETVLYKAAFEGREEVVRLLLENCADVAAVGEYGETALHIATWLGHEGVVQLLLEKGADIAAVRNDGQMVLQSAVWGGHEGLVRRLLEKGADVTAVNKHGETALHEAAYNGCKEIVRLLLEKGADITAVNKNGETALYKAACKGHEEIVRLLLENGADIAAVRKDGETALHSAATKGHEGVVWQLLEKGADVAAVDKDSHTALQSAARGGHEGAVRRLLEKGADVTAVNKDGETALHEAAYNGCKEIVRLLLEKGADITAVRKDGETALHFAAKRGHKSVVRLLLEKDADITTTNKYGETALHTAVYGGRKGVTRLLLEKGANIAAATTSGWTALKIASWGGHKSVEHLLLEKRAIEVEYLFGLEALFSIP